MDTNFEEIQNTKFTDPVLKEVESVLFYLVQSYASLIKNPDNTHEKIQEFDKELGDFLERYQQLYNITSNLTELELQKIAVEFRNEITLSKNSISQLNTTLTDKVNIDYKATIDGYINQVDLLKASVGDLILDLQSKVENNFFKGDKGEPFRFSDFTQEQIELLKIKGDKGDPFTYADFTPEQLDLLFNIHSKTEKTSLIDTDEIAVASSADGFSIKKISWSNIKTLLSSIFIKKILTPITGALTKINADGSLGNSNIIEKATKNILIGTDIDNGADLLQLNGTSKFKNPPRYSALPVFLSVNMNNLSYEGGIYCVDNSGTNFPLVDFGIVEVLFYHQLWVLQRFTCMGYSNIAYAGRTFTRMLIDGTTWSAWREL